VSTSQIRPVRPIPRTEPALKVNRKTGDRKRRTVPRVGGGGGWWWVVGVGGGGVFWLWGRGWGGGGGGGGGGGDRFPFPPAPACGQFLFLTSESTVNHSTWVGKGRREGERSPLGLAKGPTPCTPFVWQTPKCPSSRNWGQRHGSKRGPGL